MKINGFILLFFLNIGLCLQYKYEYEIINEYIPKSSLLFIKNKSFKIYEYTPSCEGIFNISIGIFTHKDMNFYLYDKYENINQNYDGYFINYYDAQNVWSEYNKIIRYNSLSCKKKYYLILFNMYEIPNCYKLYLINEKNTIYLNLSLSNEFYFTNVYNEQETFIYNYTENKNATIEVDETTNVTIIENEKIIYNNETRKGISLNFLFKKNIEYKIIIYTNYSNSLIYFQFSEESKYFKINYAEQNSLILFGDRKYIFEIDISKYKTGEYIFFLLNYRYYTTNLYIKYQYKNKFNGNNYIDLGYKLYNLKYNSFIQLNNEENNNIILNIECYAKYEYYLTVLNYEIKEITSNEFLTINEPTILYLDYYNFNHYNSFGIYSNNNFFFIESEVDEADTFIYIDINFYSEFSNIIINKKDFKRFYEKRRALIFIDNNKINQTQSTFIEFKKYNFPILYRETKTKLVYSIFSQYYQFHEYDESKSEFYFYLNYNPEYKQLIYPIYGDYIANFIREKDIKTSSDFDFDKFNESNFFNSEEDIGFLRIKSHNKPSMFKYIDSEESRISDEVLLNPGNKYYFLVDKINYLTINSSFTHKIIPLKFRVFGLKSNKTITLILDDKNYILRNNVEFKIDFYHTKNKSQLIHFTGKIESNYIVEIKVGFLNFNSYNIIDYKDSLGKIKTGGKLGCIIKIPSDLDKKFYNFTILTEDMASIEITYDELYFAVPGKILQDRNVINLFKNNPYLNIKKEDNKFLFITISCARQYFGEIYIKKQFPLNLNFEYNKINVIPKVSNYSERYNYYYKIKIPKTDYSYLTIQSYKKYNQFNYISTTYNEFNYVEIGGIKHNYQNNNKDSNESMYINYFGTRYNNYINLVPRKIYYLDYFSYKIKQHNITQKYEENKIKITLESLKYYYKLDFLFYLILNDEDVDYNPYVIISGQRNSSDMKVFIFEDNGQNEIIEYEAEIDIDFGKQNITNFIVPVDKETKIIRTEYITKNYVHFTYHPKKNYTYYIIGGCGALLIIIVIIIIISIYKKKKKNNNENNQDFHGSSLLEKSTSDIN